MMRRTGFGVLWLICGIAQARAECLTFGPGVRLSGIIVRKTFPGAPNFESIAGGDEPETGLYLQLRSAICGRAPVTDADPEDPQDNVTFVQLNIEFPRYHRFRALVNKSVTLEGNLYSAITGHHHAPILMDNIKLVSLSARRDGLHG